MKQRSYHKDREDLEQCFANLAEDFSKVDRQVQNYLTEFTDKVRKFEKDITPRGSIEGPEAIIKSFEKTRELNTKKCGDWLACIEQSKKNMRLRDKLNDSMLVYVYGKVKSGKSSLGNFMAYGKHDPTVEETRNHQPPVDFAVEVITAPEKEEDREKLEKQKKATEEERKFLVAFAECTACIQYFRKKGFTWVDSPGIHSMTEANGKLAKDYLDSADVIIFTNNGRSAMQENDKKELLEIAKSGKPFLLVITRCDEKEEDVDENGEIIEQLTMLPPSDREAIFNWSTDQFEEELRKNKLSCPELRENTFTLSCRYAETYAEDGEKWEESGVPALFSRLQEVAVTDGIRIKREAPLRSVLSLLQNSASHLPELKKQNKDGLEELKKWQKEFRDEYERICGKYAGEIQRKIGEQAEKLYGNDEKFKEEALKITEYAYQAGVCQLVQGFTKGALDYGKTLAVKIDPPTLKAFEDIEQTITYESTGKRRGGTLLGAVAGAAIGFAFWGPVGAAIGAGIGSTGGNVAGGMLDDRKSSRVKVGDNRREVARETAKTMQELFESKLREVQDKLEKSYIKTLEEIQENIAHRIEEFENFLTDKQKEIQKELS